MNVDIGESIPKKLEIYRDTDPESEAIAFVKESNLPEAMVPTIAQLIS